MTDLSEQDKALCEALEALEDGSDYPFDFNTARSAQIRIRELLSLIEGYGVHIKSITESRDNFAAALMAAQRNIDALQQHAEAMAEAIDDALESLDEHTHSHRFAIEALSKPLTDWTAWLIDGGDDG